jgi:hypothetical protein
VEVRRFNSAHLTSKNIPLLEGASFAGRGLYDRCVKVCEWLQHQTSETKFSVIFNFEWWSFISFQWCSGRRFFSSGLIPLQIEHKIFYQQWSDRYGVVCHSQHWRFQDYSFFQDVTINTSGNALCGIGTISGQPTSWLPAAHGSNQTQLCQILPLILGSWVTHHKNGLAITDDPLRGRQDCPISLQLIFPLRDITLELMKGYQFSS